MLRAGPSSPASLPPRAGSGSAAIAADGLPSAAQLLAQASLARATDLARLGRYDQAERLLADLGRDREAQLGELDLLARIKAQQGRFREAEALWSRALRLAPESASAQSGLRRVTRLQARPLLVLLSGPLTGLLVGLALVGLAAVLVASAGRSGDSGERLDGRLAGLEQRLDQRLGEHLNALAGMVQSVQSGAPAQLPPVDRVQAALAADADLQPLGLTVSAAGSAIVLSGNVPSDELKTRADATARAVAGSAPIDSGRLTVAAPGLTRAVEQALGAEAGLQGSTIVVEQVSNAVKLRGSVPSAEQRALAEATAGRVSGVALVDGRALVVTPPALTALVRQALAAEPRLAGLSLEAEQIGAAIRLRGQAPSAGIRLLADSTARGVPGVTLVDTGGISVDETLVEHVVLPGDSLAGLALRYYGDETKWPLIYAANRDRLVSPRALEAGVRLVIPRTV